jgi:RNA polymerase sigma-70 factor (ECF subfamily)
MTPEQFNNVYRSQLAEISRFLARRVAPHEVEDLAADLFEIAWTKRDSIPQDLELPWLYKTARYLIANHRRKTQNRARIFSMLSAPEAAPSAESIALADVGLGSAWEKLSSADRELISLWSLEGLDAKEIAVVMEISPNAAAIRLTRAKEKLRVLLAHENSETEKTLS